MKKVIIWIALGILIIALIFFIKNIFNLGYKTLTEEPVIINSDTSGKLSSELDAELEVKKGDGNIVEIILRGKNKVLRSEGFTEKLKISSLSGLTAIPLSGLSLVDGDLEWEGTVAGNEIAEITAKAKTINEGEINILGCVRSDDYRKDSLGNNVGSASDCEIVYLLVKGDNIFVSNEPFTKIDYERQPRPLAS